MQRKLLFIASLRVDSFHMFSKTQVDKLGARLVGGEIAEADLRGRDAYRQLAGPEYAAVVSGIHSLGLAVTGRPSKSTRSIVDKLRRESCRLSQVQDIAGCRVVTSNCSLQDKITADIMAKFSGLRLIDRREKPSFGYRAIHLVRSQGPVPIEIQIRSVAQHAWAELSEKLSDRFGTEIKYGGGLDQVRDLLITTSSTIQEIEHGERQLTQLEKAALELSTKLKPNEVNAMKPEVEEAMHAVNHHLAKSRSMYEDLLAKLLSNLSNFLTTLD